MLTSVLIAETNANNLKFEPIINEIEELTYIKKYCNLFDSKIDQFASSEILEQKINQDFDQEMALIKHDDPLKNIRISELENKKLTDLDSLKCLKKKEKQEKKESKR